MPGIVVEIRNIVRKEGLFCHILVEETHNKQQLLYSIKCYIENLNGVTWYDSDYVPFSLCGQAWKCNT